MLPGPSTSNMHGFLLQLICSVRIVHYSADNSELLKAGGSAVIFDYFNDTRLVRKGERAYSTGVGCGCRLQAPLN